MNEATNELDLIEKQHEMSAGATFFKFDEVGKKLDATLISREQGESSLGQNQIIYLLKNADGLFKAAFNSTYAAIHRDVQNAKVGQIVRFTYLEDKPHRVKGYNPIKIIRVFTRPDLIDNSIAEWLDQYGLKVGDDLPPVDMVAEAADGEKEGPKVGSAFPATKK